MDVELVVLTGASAGDKFKFDLNESGVVIGRSADCDLVLQDQLVSRKHAKLFTKGSRVRIADMASSHGTLHMGFRLEPGDENSRVVYPGEEFKLGESLFRVEYQEPEEPVVPASDGRPPRKAIPRKTLLTGALGAVAVLAIAFLLFGDDDSGPVQQRSNERISIPDKKAYGYLAEGDKSHADKVQYEVPTSDIVLEYDFSGADTTAVLLDGVKIENLPKTDGSWVPRMLLIRDPIGGKERLLTFDEETIREELGAPAGKLKRWGIRNTRYTSLPAEENRTTDELVSGAASLAEQVGRSNDSLFRLSRVLEKVGLRLIRESGLEAQAVPITLESGKPDPELMTLKLGGIVSERRNGGPADATVRHLKVVIELIGSCEAELWRKFTIQVKQALSLSRAKDYIGAHDTLLGLQTMIGDEDDYRWKKALELLDDKKVVPPKIRKNPGKFRREM